MDGISVHIAAIIYLLLFVVVVGAGKEMSKNEFRHMDLLLLVDLHRHPCAIVVHLDAVVGLQSNSQWALGVAVRNNWELRHSKAGSTFPAAHMPD